MFMHLFIYLQIHISLQLAYKPGSSMSDIFKYPIRQVFLKKFFTYPGGAGGWKGPPEGCIL